MGAILCDTKVLDINGPAVLSNGEIRRVSPVGIRETVRIGILVQIIKLVQIKEVGNNHLFRGAQCFVVDSNGLFRPLIDNLLAIFRQDVLHCRKVGLGHIAKE